ncbi:PREDICTED: phospholipase A1 member A-like [Nicrophorus vespilloides]|uniref:Phospholipase A1 member A-like n=1 Tax=Nicrophorus vespilloides TaxID=110193 RepID=A0ABM1MSN9_NICVS|nr:PREDICTED: phospholipase A1 member A-like [Nicrophorus vespilloides]
MSTVAAAATAMSVLVASTFLLVVMMAKGQDAQRLAASAAITNKNNISQLLEPNGPPVQFIVFVNGQKPYNLKIGDFRGFEDSGFNTSLPTKIITHGFMSSIREEIFVMMKNAYLSTGDYNVVGMDWSVLCEFEYFSAMKGAQLAGEALNNFINFIARAGVNLEDVHVIGHSLGAHVAGIAGDGIKNGKLGRITGLDPAGPGYNDVPPNLRLDPGDAKLVDVIHTYMRILSLAQPLGHVDFYPNGGRFQPGCPELYDIWKVTESIACNHGRAYMYFIESILNEKAFKSQKCANVDEAIYSRCFEESDVYMGQADTYKYGLYYVKTNTKYPFSLT